MEVGFHFINFTLPGAPDALATTLAETATAAEQSGCTQFTMADHLFQMEGTVAGVSRAAEDAMLEGYTTLGFLAGQTERIRLGMLVTGVMFRYPAVLAKTVTTLDVLSRGRAVLGLGAAWYDREHVGLGVPYPPVGERFERLEETLRISLQMWSDNNGAFDGRHYQLAETICVPPPIQRPRPPIVIGGGGERKTLRLVARYADIWCAPGGTPPDVVRHKIAVLAEHCEAEGRDPADIRTMILAPQDPLADTDGFLSAMEEYAGLGVAQVMVSTLAPDPVSFASRLGDRVVPRLAQLGS
jgi:F420-dependent oxidoreductase-like protein